MAITGFATRFSAFRNGFTGTVLVGLAAFGMLSVASIFGAQAAHAEAVPAEHVGGASCSKKYPGSFLDVGTNKYWSCPSEAPARTIYSVEGPKACEKSVFSKKTHASVRGRPGCSRESFENGLTGECFKCPTGTVRNLNIAGDLTKIKACTPR